MTPKQKVQDFDSDLVCRKVTIRKKDIYYIVDPTSFDVDAYVAAKDKGGLDLWCFAAGRTSAAAWKEAANFVDDIMADAETYEGFEDDTESYYDPDPSVDLGAIGYVAIHASLVAAAVFGVATF